MTAPVVTVSAAYGAGGQVIAERVASRLKVPVVDQEIPADVALRLQLAPDVIAAHDEQTASGVSRFWDLFSRSALPLGEGVRADVIRGEKVEEVEQRRYVAATEAAVGRAAASGGVVLGRAAALILRNRPGALHVRVHGPVWARLRQAMADDGLDHTAAQQRLDGNDRFRKAYTRHLYNVDVDDPRAYHLVLYSTALSYDACSDLIIAAFKSGPSPLGPVGRIQRPISELA